MDLVTEIKKSGMPSTLWAKAVREEVHEDLAPKLTTLKEMVAEDHRIFLFTGDDSPYKDEFCAAFMKWFMQTKVKTGKWVSVSGKMTDEEIGNAGITILPATYLYSPIQAKNLSGIIRERVASGRVFVICYTDKDSFETVFGKEFVAFASHNSLSVDLGVPRASITEI